MLHFKFAAMAKRIVVVVLAAALITGALTACGQKGDLYLPPEDEKSEKKK